VVWGRPERQEIRRLLWRVVLAVQQTAHHILAWSYWRRGHQAIAKYYHDKRRGALERFAIEIRAHRT
jgi:hypothetical protein